MSNHNHLKQSLLSGTSNPSDAHGTNHNDTTRRRRFLRSKSAPLADHIPRDLNDTTSTSRSESLFGNIHPSFQKVAAFLCIYLGIGTITFYIVRYQVTGKKTNGIVDALYFCVVTMTTVGYGDLVPHSTLVKLLACAFVFSGMALVALVLSKGADYLVEKQEALLIRALNMHQKLGPSDIMKKIETNKAKYKCFLAFFLLLVIVMSGTLFLAFVEKLPFIDAFYCVCVTITTLGYGDKSFSTEGGRVFAVFWILTGTLCLAQFLLYVAEVNAENRQRGLVKWVLTRRVTNLDLEAADIDQDGVVEPAEFVLYKLKEMGKITQEDITLVMKEFEELDVDQSGTLTPSDIALAQSPLPPR